MSKSRIIVSLFIRNKLAYLSSSFNKLIYVGDPLTIIQILSKNNIDELLLIDLSSSESGAIDTSILRSIRYLADFPVSYSGGLNNCTNISKVFRLGFDKVFLNPFSADLNDLQEYVCKFFGKQSSALSVPYIYNLRGLPVLYNSAERRASDLSLTPFLHSINLNFISDILLTNVNSTGKTNGADYKIIHSLPAAKFSNPVILSGGVNMQDIQNINLSDNVNLRYSLAASSLYFLQNPSRSNSALVSVEKILK